MENIKYVCSECGCVSQESGLCPDCRVVLVATCLVCGNPVVGEHIYLEEW